MKTKRIVALAAVLALGLTACKKEEEPPAAPPTGRTTTTQPAPAPPSTNPPPAGTNAATAPSTTTVKYACPMHPEVTDVKPGKCSKCGMDLAPVKSESAPTTP